jgi:alpha-tubulin suppressor-like RCC1 family protein
VLSNHTVKCWGKGRDGALGDGSDESSATPVEVSGITSAVSIAAADSFACAVLENGEARCWGKNNYDDLGKEKAKQNRNTATCQRLWPGSPLPPP